MDLTIREQGKDIRGSQVVELSASQGVRIQSGAVGSPDTLLEEQVPSGKKWTALITVNITETDA